MKSDRDYMKLKCMEMNKVASGFAMIGIILSSIYMQDEIFNSSTCEAIRPELPMTIDAKWDKPQWKKVKAIEIKNVMGDVPKFTPRVKAKLMFDNENIYAIFNVRDRYVRCTVLQINGPVWNDSCVEFFFSPDINHPERYFNLEVNCCGTPLMHYNIKPREEIKVLDVEDISRIEIAHTLTDRIEQEISGYITWTVEYKLPINILRKYSDVTQPASGVSWRANFYKIADKTSNPHYLTWSKVENVDPDFHLPGFFGQIKFK